MQEHTIDGVRVRTDDLDLPGLKWLKPDMIARCKEMNAGEPEGRRVMAARRADEALSCAGIPLRYADTEMHSLQRVGGNDNAFQVAQTFIENALERLRAGRGIVFNGAVGCGKTALAIAIVKEIARTWTTAPTYEYVIIPDGLIQFKIHHFRKSGSINTLSILPMYISTRAFLESLKPTGDRTNERVKPWAVRASDQDGLTITILDDLGSEYQTEWAHDQIDSFINHCYENRISLIVTTNQNKDELSKRIGARATDRLWEMCTWRSFTCESWRGKTA